MSKLIWNAAAIPGAILITLPMVVMLECDVNTDSTQVKFWLQVVSYCVKQRGAELAGAVCQTLIDNG